MSYVEQRLIVYDPNQGRYTNQPKIDHVQTRTYPVWTDPREEIFILEEASILDDDSFWQAIGPVLHLFPASRWKDMACLLRKLPANSIYWAEIRTALRSIASSNSSSYVTPDHIQALIEEFNI